MRKRVWSVVVATGLCLCLVGCNTGTSEVSMSVKGSGPASEASESDGEYSSGGDSSSEDDNGSEDSALSFTEWVKKALGIVSEYDVPKSAESKGENSDGSSGGGVNGLAEIDGGTGIGIYSNDGIATTGGIAQNSSMDSVEHKVSTQDENVSSDLSAYRNTKIEFVSYPAQTISESMSMVFTNLSCNAGIGIVFTLDYEGKSVSSHSVQAGGSWSVNAADLGLKERSKPYSVTVTSQAFAPDGTKLSAVTQSIEVTVVGGHLAKQESTYHDNQPNGAVYQTAIVYEADNTVFSAIVPAVVAVSKGDVGSDVSVGFRVLNAKDGMNATIKASGADGKADVVLTGGDKSVKAVLSGEKSGNASLSHTYSGGEESLEEVGPIHCNIEQGKAAGVDYFGTVNYSLSLTGV